MRHGLSVVLCSLLFTIQHSAAQGGSALPFLLIHSSPEANAYGNAASSVMSTNAIAVIANPAHLGIFGLENYFGVSFYSPKTPWLPTFGVPDLTYNVWAASGGMNLTDILSLPIPFALGFGYSKVELNLGEFLRVDPSGFEVGRFNAFETARQFSVGIGAKYYASVALGWNFKSITSQVSAGPAGEAIGIHPSATDFGMLIHADVFDILSQTGTDVTVAGDMQPVLSLTAGYARRNIGNEVRHPGELQSDPLPRTATLGLSIEGGLATTIGGKQWKILSALLVREAGDLLIARTPSRLTYKSGLGDIRFLTHVINGKLGENDPVELHKGWQLNFGEFVYIRGGSFAEAPQWGNRRYSTNGYGIHLGGFLRFIRYLGEWENNEDVMQWILDHLDLRYDYAQYVTAPDSPLAGTHFSAFTVVLR